MMIRSIACTLAILLTANTYADTTEDEQMRYQLEQQFAVADAEVQASRISNAMIEEDISLEKQTTIVDEGGNLKIIDKDKTQTQPSAQPSTPAEPKPADSMPGGGKPTDSTGAAPKSALTPPATPPGAPPVDMPPPAKGKGSYLPSTPLDLYPGQELSPESAAIEAQRPQAATPQEAPIPSSPIVPNDGQAIPQAPSMPNPGNGMAPTPTPSAPGNPNQAPMQPNMPPSMPMPQSGSMPAAPPAVDQIR